jgi:PAS domain S-box-containing protein
MIPITDEERIAPRGVGKYLAQIAVVFAVQFAAGKLGDALQIINSGGIGPVWPASGVALAALMLFGYQVWPGVAAGAFLLAFLSPIPHIAAVVYAAGTTLAALTGAFLLRRVVSFRASLSRLRDALWLIVFGAFGSSIVSASVGVSVLYAAQVRGWSGFGKAWVIYWLGDSMGVLLVTPLVLTFPNLLRIRTWVRIAELGGLLLALTAVSLIIFGDLGSVPVKLDVLAFAVLPFVIWAAIRFGVSGAALSALFIAGIATAETTSGSGPFDQNTPFINAAMLDVFFAVLSVSGLMLAAVIAEREQAEREREQLVAEQAAMDVRLRLATIVESSDDAIIGEDMCGIITDWNKGAEQLYGYSAGEVIGKPISALLPPDRSGDFAGITGKHDTINRYETEHQRKDGTRIEVSLTISLIKDVEGRIVGSSVIARDISQRKRQEAVLRESEERFRLMADTAPVLIWMADTDKLCTYFNKPWLDFTGRSIDSELGNGWAEGVHSEDLAKCLDTYTQAFDRREEFRMEYRLRRHDGEYRWVLDIAVPRFNQDLSFVGYIGIGIDVTERKLADERLREYEKAVEGSEEMIAVVDREYRYLIANRRFLSVRNMTKEQVVGHLVSEVLTKRVFDEVIKEKLDECFRGKVVRYEMKYTYPDLGERDVFVSYFPIEGPTGVHRIACIMQDVTERKRSEEALRKSEERFRLAAQAGKMFAYEWDAVSDVIVRSAESAQLLGIDDATLTTGKQILTSVHPDDRERLKTAVAELSSEKPYLQISYRIVRPDGNVIWVQRNSRAHFNEQGRLLRIVGMVADITERKRAEEALERSESNYRMFVAQSSEGIFCQELERPIPVALPEDEQIQRILHESYMAECNDALARMYGMSPADFVGKRLTETLDAQNPVNIELTCDYIRGGYRVVDRESHEVDPEGNPKVFVNSMIGIVENGMLLRTWGIQRDITDRRQAEQARAHAEQALRASEQRFRLAAQAAKMYAYEWDVASDTVVRSEEHVNVLGFDDQPKQLTRQQLLARVHTDDRALFAGSVDQLSPENPTIQISYRMVRPDGSVVWLEKSARAFFDEQGRMFRVIGMVADITERKRTEEALRESEDKLRLLLDSTAESIYGIDLEHRCTFCNPACLRALGYERIDEVLGKNMHDLMHHTRPDGTLFAVEECRVHQVIRTGEGVHADDEVLWRANGTSFPAEYWSYPQRRGRELVGAVVAFIDITERKLAEVALANVSRKLIEAQEQERSRIARDLHDDIGQRLALLTIELERLQENSPDLPVEVRSRMGELQKQTSEIASDVQTLSHELHSAKLEYLGLAAAMRGFCREFGEQQNVEIGFTSHDLPLPLSPDISLCLFRVLQEALHNSAKHSGVRHFEVRLWGTSDEIHLTVRDSGAGFDSEAAKESRGLGLISMEERLKLVKGTFSIESQPSRGTTIHARVPLSSGSGSMRAAG